MQGFSQMGVQASCGQPLFKEYYFVFHILPEVHVQLYAAF